MKWVLSLPMRDGNQGEIEKRIAEFNCFELTYEGWKLSKNPC